MKPRKIPITHFCVAKLPFNKGQFYFFKRIVNFIFLLASIPLFAQQNQKPNVVIIYADDMGYSDVGVYGELFDTPSPANTPNMDKLAADGMLFTNAHSSNGVCTPSRYALLTGTYNWRTLPTGVTGAYASQEMPDEDVTIAEYLKTQGYDTAAFGKWHLGGTIYNRNGTPYIGRDHNITNPNQVDWERPIEGHALDHGFDVFKGKHNAISRAPHLYVEGKRFQYFDSNTNQYRNALNSDTYSYFKPFQSRKGLGDPSYDVYDVEPRMISQVEDYIAEREDQNTPFFMYVALNSPHKPWVVTPPFVGSEGFTYGDFMHEVDARIGRVIEAIDNHGFKNNTIIILSSDNGPETSAFTQSRTNGKDANGPFKGVKRDSWEGGTRVPFVVRWPNVIEKGQVSEQLIWQGDIFRTLADYHNECLPENVAPDGVSILPILDGSNTSIIRDGVIYASNVDQLSIQTTDGWKLIDGTGGGGNGTSYDGNNQNISNAKGVVGGSPKQLYYLPNDINESDNLVSTYPEKAEELLAALNRIRNGQPGLVDNNTIPTLNDCDVDAPCTYETINFSNFNDSWGIWNDGGRDSRRSTKDAAYAVGGEGRPIRLRDNTNTSVMTTNSLDLSAYEKISVAFSYITRSMDNSNEDFWLQLSTDGGATFNTVEAWNLNDEFLNDQRYNETVEIEDAFTTNVQLRFRADASGRQDWVYIDDVTISGCKQNESIQSAKTTANKTTVQKKKSIDDKTTPLLINFEVYPNPFKDQINITIKNAVDYTKATVDILDLTGRRVHISTHNQKDIRLNNLQIPSGLYLVRLIINDTVETKKIIKL